MQTFLPYSFFDLSANCLDNKRLGKQRVETLQILKSLATGTGWKNHPVTVMWKNHTNALIEYGICICNEWIKRGYQDTCLGKIKSYYQPHSNKLNPRWLFDNRLTDSHRSNLLRKDTLYYSKFNWAVSSDLEYFWPTKNGY